MGEFFKFVFRFFHGWQRKTAALVLALVLTACWARSFIFERGLIDMDYINSTQEFVFSGNEHPIVGFGADNRSRDSTEYQILPYERDPATGSRCFTLNGLPVQGKLKAFLDAATENGTLAIMINHPDGESSKWVEIPTPLFLSLTDQSPSP